MCRNCLISRLAADVCINVMEYFFGSAFTERTTSITRREGVAIRRRINRTQTKSTAIKRLTAAKLYRKRCIFAVWGNVPWAVARRAVLKLHLWHTSNEYEIFALYLQLKRYKTYVNILSEPTTGDQQNNFQNSITDETKLPCLQSNSQNNREMFFYWACRNGMCR